MPWYRWVDPARAGAETEITTTSGRVVRGRVVSHGAEVDDLRAVDLVGRDVQTTVVDEDGCYHTGREVGRPQRDGAGTAITAPPAAA